MNRGLNNFYSFEKFNNFIVFVLFLQLIIEVLIQKSGTKRVIYTAARLLTNVKFHIAAHLTNVTFHI